MASHAQTTPATAPTGSTPAVSGTKNVGSDRADAPQAPGMSTPGPARATGTRKSKSTNQRGAVTPKKPATATSPQ